MYYPPNQSMTSKGVCRHLRVLLTCVAVILLGGGVWGCGSAIDIERPYLLLSELSGPQTFNSYLSNDSGSRVAIGPTLTGLTKLDEETLEWVPELAESWEIEDDGLRVIFTLRSGLQWSDGEPLTARDVAFTFEQIIFNEAIPTSSRDVMRIGDSQALPQFRLIDDLHVEFTLPEPFAPFFQIVGVPIYPAHILADSIALTDEEGQPEFLSKWSISTPPDELLSNGPYVITDYVPNQRLEYEPNPYYYRSEVVGEELPRLPRIVRQIVASQDNQLLQFRSGSVDIFSGVRGSDFQLLKQGEAAGEYTVYSLGPSLTNNYISFNQSAGNNPETGEPLVDPIKHRWFADVNFRRAVSHALNRQGWIDSVLRGLGAPQTSPISPANPFHFSPEEGLPVYNYNPDTAREILLAAGYTYDQGDRLHDPEGNEVRFTLNTNVGNTDREAIGALVTQDLDAIGITVDFIPLEFGNLVAKLSNNYDWEAILLGFAGGGTEPNSGANIWRSTGQLHVWNPQGTTQPVPNRVVTDWELEIDDIFSAGTRELEFEKRRELYNRFQVIVQEQLPIIGTVNSLSLVAIRDRIIGADPRPILGDLWNLDELSLTP